MKRARVFIGGGVALLFLASVMAALLQPSPIDVARARCLREGWRAEDLALLGYYGTRTLFNQRETVEFRVKGPLPKTIRVELHKPLYFLGWRAVDFREEIRAVQP